MAKHRLPCAVPLTTREVGGAQGSYVTDTALVNCYVELSADKNKAYVVKRPAAIQLATYNGGTPTNGQGTVRYKGMTLAVGSNTLFTVVGTATTAADGTAWTNVGTAPTFSNRRAFASIVFNGQILVIGGVGPGFFVPTNDVWSSVDGITWTQLIASAPWGPRYGHQVVVLGNTLYLMGGFGATTYNDVWATTDGVNWVQVTGAAGWASRRDFQAVVYNQTIVVAGGWNSSTATYYNDVWVSADGSTWTQTQATAAWSARRGMSMLVFRGALYLFGGHDGANALTDCWKSVDSTNWTAAGNLPARRYFMASCVYADKMWLMCGLDNAGLGTTTVWSTTDAAAFTVVTAAFGGAADAYGVLVSFPSTTTVSAINAAVMFFLSGNAAQNPYRSTLNVAMPASQALSTTGANTEQFSITTQNLGYYLLLKNSADLFIFSEGSLKKVSAYTNNYPTKTVPGIVNLDDTVYVMDAGGVIYGSILSTPLIWMANNYITADFTDDVGVALYKHKRYVVAFKSTTIQFFYDAGRYPGSPLLPVQDATLKVGCVDAGSITTLQDTLYFLARTEKYTRCICRFNGFQPERISTPDVERLLNAAGLTTMYAFGMGVNGHPCYFLTLLNTATLVFDTVTSQWHIWTQVVDTGVNVFQGINYFTDETGDLLQDRAKSIIYRMASTAFADTAGTITCKLYLDKFDAGTNVRKFVGDTCVIGDRRSGGSLLVQWSDDDSQTFNTGITVDLSQPRPHFPRGGSFRRRTYQLTHADDTHPMRLEAVELSIIGGS